jgi:hypothetical protein
LRSRVSLNNFGATIKKLLIVALLAQGVRPAEDGVYRRAQFVGDKGNELVLRPVGALCLAARLSLSRQSLFEPLLGLPAAGDVAGDFRRANDFSALISDGRDRQRDVDLAAVFAATFPEG